LERHRATFVPLLGKGEADERIAMPRGDKSKYTDKQERKADHIAEGYKRKGVSTKEAESRAWATVNKDDGGGKKPGGSGRGKRTGHPAAKKGGRMGGRAAAARPAAARSRSAKKAAATRKRRGS
jgi:plasmid stabilization system protein ParE